MIIGAYPSVRLGTQDEIAKAAHLWTLRAGKITAFQQYIDTKKPADAATN
jgi:hypothetical protein